MIKREFARRTITATLLILLLVITSNRGLGQINQLPPPPLADPVLLNDIFQATKKLQDQFRAMEFKERISFRLAAVINENRANRNVDYRQSADYAVTIKPGQQLERKFLQANHGPRFGMNTVERQFDIPTIQETLPTIASLQMALLGFVTSEFVNGYKELGHDNVKKHRAIKLELRFRPGRLPVERCLLWIDEQSHEPLKAEIKIGDIGRFNDVLLLISYEDVGKGPLPTSIHQEMDCNTYDRGIPIRLEHSSVYTELKPIAVDR